MRQVWIAGVGPPEKLVVREAPEPEPSPGTVRIRVRASGVNFADVLARQGLYPDAPRLPAVVGYEVSGVIDKVGEGVASVSLGQKVICLCRFGGYSDTVIARESQVFPLPEGWSFEEGAALPVNYLTAYQILFAMGGVREGDKVLIHSAGGGVGFASLDLCRIAKAEALGVASRAKHAAILEAGATHVFDSRSDDIVEKVKAATDGKGVQIALDPNGGRSWRRSLDCLAPGGRLAIFGIASAAGRTRLGRLAGAIRTLAETPLVALNPFSLINRNAAVLGVNLGHLWHRPDLVRAWMEELLAWARAGKIRPRLDATVPLEEAPVAHARLENRLNLGKVVLVCS